MCTLPEQFDFSKLEEQKKFEELPEGKREEYIEKSHKEALELVENISELEKVGLSQEEINIAKNYIMNGENVWKAVNKAQIEFKFNGIEEEFVSKKIEDINEKDKDKLNEEIIKMINFFGGETIHFGIEKSPAENFFHYASSRIKNEKNMFIDKKTLELLAKNVINIFLDMESKRKFAFEVPDPNHAYCSKIIYKSDSYHVARKQRDAASFLGSLEFFEDAYGLYRNSPLNQGNGFVDRAGAEIANILKRYVKSGQKSEILDSALNAEILEIKNIKFRGNPFRSERSKEEIVELFKVVEKIKSAIKELKELGVQDTELKDVLKDFCNKGGEGTF